MVTRTKSESERDEAIRQADIAVLRAIAWAAHLREEPHFHELQLVTK